MFSKIYFVKNDYFHNRLSSEVKNDIINGSADYIIVINDIKHVMVIFSIRHIFDIS